MTCVKARLPLFAAAPSASVAAAPSASAVRAAASPSVLAQHRLNELESVALAEDSAGRYARAVARFEAATGLGVVPVEKGGNCGLIAAALAGGASAELVISEHGVLCFKDAAACCAARELFAVAWSSAALEDRRVVDATTAGGSAQFLENLRSPGKDIDAAALSLLPLVSPLVTAVVALYEEPDGTYLALPVCGSGAPARLLNALGVSRATLRAVARSMSPFSVWRYDPETGGEPAHYDVCKLPPAWGTSQDAGPLEDAQRCWRRVARVRRGALTEWGGGAGVGLRRRERVAVRRRVGAA